MLFFRFVLKVRRNKIHANHLRVLMRLGGAGRSAGIIKDKNILNPLVLFHFGDAVGIDFETLGELGNREFVKPLLMARRFNNDFMSPYAVHFVV